MTKRKPQTLQEADARSSATEPEAPTPPYEHPSVEEARAVFELWNVTRVVVFYRDARDGIQRYVEFEPEAVRGLMKHSPAPDDGRSAAPDLARLCAELGEALKPFAELDYWPDGGYHISHKDLDSANAVLVKLSELNTGAEHSPSAERT